MGGCRADSECDAVFRPLAPLIRAVPFSAGRSRCQDPPGGGAPEHQRPQPLRASRSKAQPAQPALLPRPPAPQRQPAHAPPRQGPAGRRVVGDHPGPQQRVGESISSPAAFAQHPRNGGQARAWGRAPGPCTEHVVAVWPVFSLLSLCEERGRQFFFFFLSAE